MGNIITPEQYAHTKLLSYAKVMNPRYINGKMHSMLGEYLEAVEAGHIRRLLIFAPPQNGKSHLTSEFFPSWCIGRNPEWSIIAATYAQERANDVGVPVRNQVDSDVHRSIFPDCCISPDSKSAKHFTTIQGGHYYSVGMKASITGRGAHLLLIDDPVKGREEVESRTIRRKVVEWFKSDAYTRLRPDNRIVIILTRWHTHDLAGYVLSEQKQENWVVLDFKAIAEKGDILGREIGEPLFPEWYPLDVLENKKIVLGSYNWNSLYQQHPTPKEGGMVKSAWLRRYSDNPGHEDKGVVKTPEKYIKIVISWDTAGKTEELHDPTVATVWGITKNSYYLLDVLNKKMEFPQLVRAVKRLHNIHNPSIHLIEDRGSGQSLIQDLQQNTTIPIKAVSVKGLDKIIRLDAVTGLFEAGKVFIPVFAHWLDEYEHQILNFPGVEHDDMVDATSQFLKWTSKKKYKRKAQKDLYWK